MTSNNSNDEVRPFATFLMEQRKGSTHDELTDGLRELVEHVRDTGKKGSLQLTITVAPMKDNVDILLVTDDIKRKLPEHDRQPSIFYPDGNGNLSRRDPNQLEIGDLQELPDQRTA